ncbi:MAG: hypothetical protein ABIR17_07180 [Pseudolysinimonas sp.]|uniref:hypothetical protein n=1 Tax=Pseudolysinimonas sp. TaxID=2680009 RepID=UPI0032672325
MLEHPTPTSKPTIGPVRAVVAVLFTIGLLALLVEVIAGRVLRFDAMWALIWTGAGCLALAVIWSLGGDFRSWFTASKPLRKSIGLVRSEPLAGIDISAAPADPGVVHEVAEDESRLDRRRITRLVAEAQAKDRKLKKRD